MVPAHLLLATPQKVLSIPLIHVPGQGGASQLGHWSLKDTVHSQGCSHALCLGTRNSVALSGPAPSSLSILSSNIVFLSLYHRHFWHY